MRSVVFTAITIGCGLLLAGCCHALHQLLTDAHESGCAHFVLNPVRQVVARCCRSLRLVRGGHVVLAFQC
jgi:hypothetical protein